LVFVTVAACAQPAAPAPTPEPPAQETPSEEAPQEEAPPEIPAEPDLLRVAITPQMIAAPFFMEERLGFFAEEGIILETTSFPAMAPAIAALASGDLDISFMGPGVHPLAARGDAEIFMHSHSGIGDFFFVNSESGMTTIEDLLESGAPIGVPRGSTADMLLTLVLRTQGFDPNDFNIVNMDVAGVVSGMAAGAIHAAAIWEPNLTEIKLAVGPENIIILGDAADYTDYVAFTASYGATPAFVAENEDLIIRFIRAFRRHMDYMIANPVAAIDATMEHTEGSREAHEAQQRFVIFFTADEILQHFQDGTALAMYDSLISVMYEVGATEYFAPASEWVNTELLIRALS